VRFLAVLPGVALALVVSACGSSSTAPSTPASTVQLMPQTQIVLNIAGHTATYTMTVNGQPYTGGADCTQTQGGTAAMVNGQIVFTPGLIAGLYPVVCIPTGMTASGTANVQVAKMTHIVYAPVGVPFVNQYTVFLDLGAFSASGAMLNVSSCGAVHIGSGDSWACDVLLSPTTSYFILAADINRATPQTPVDFADGFTADGVPLGQTPDRVVSMGAGIGNAARLDVNTSYIPH
jgi:hypothetical protein